MPTSPRRADPHAVDRKAVGARTPETRRRAKAKHPRLPDRVLHLAVQYACNDERLPSRHRIRRWVGAAAMNDAEVTVRFVGAAEGRRLNREFRGKDYATNVLSFPYSNAPTVCGDLVLCLPVVVREARAQGKELAAHFAHLIVHGMLHLQDYDHERSTAEADRMEAAEREILAGMGIADPY